METDISYVSKRNMSQSGPCATQSKEHKCSNTAPPFHIQCEPCRIETRGYPFARKPK